MCSILSRTVHLFHCLESCANLQCTICTILSYVCYSALEGTGIELIELVCSALSILNRLLLLWPEGSTATSVAQSLSAASGVMDHHLVSTIAQYIYHRHCARLPCLATTLLTTLAQVSITVEGLVRSRISSI